MEEEGVKLPSNFINGNTCCKWCFNNWTQNNFTARLIPQRQQKACLRSLLKKDENSLNKFQRKLVKKCKKNCGNKLVFLCHTCNKKTVVHLKKPKLDIVKVSNIPSEKKTKKKKKDVYAGLKPATFLTTTGKKQVTNIIKKPFLNQDSTKKSTKIKRPFVQKAKDKRGHIGNKSNQNTSSLLLSLLDPL